MHTDKTPDKGHKSERKKKENKMQKSYRAPNPGENRQWFLIDAKGQPLGRLAVVVDNKLRAKICRRSIRRSMRVLS